jgi:hypothetical protein
MKGKILSVICVGILCFCLIPFNTYGTIKLTDNFGFYGFIKLDAFYQDGGMNSVLAPRYAKPGDGNLALTALNTRFGFKWTGATIGSGWKIGAQLEWDLFDGSTANQMKFRTRHANFTLTKGSSKFLLGQFWDVFAPIGPTTLNTNGYFWQVGNIGFRRAQARYTYTSGKINFAISANDPTSGGGRLTQMPVLESRLGLSLGEKGKIKIGVSGAYGKTRMSNDLYENDVDITGISVDWIIPFSKVSIKGEFTTGQNLSIFLSHGGIYNNVALQKYEGKKVNAFWSQLVYADKKINFWAGYSFEKLTDDDQLASGEINDKSCIFAGIKKICGGGVSLGLEYSYYLSKMYMGSDDAKTSQFILSFIYGF